MKIKFSCFSIMTSIALTLTQNSSQLVARYFPAIDLSDGEYVCGLIDFQTFNSIPNVDESNNLFHYGYKNVKADGDKKEVKPNYGSEDNSIADPPPAKVQNVPILKKKRPFTSIQIPTGSYELNDLNNYLQKALNKSVVLNLAANKNTLQCEILCSQPIDFSQPNSIGPLLGFRRNERLKENVLHESSSPADILKVNIIRIECNIIKGSYFNNQPSHTIHEFSPKVPPGYKIVEVPRNVIYFPVTVKSIHDLNLSIVDQRNQPINFRGESITIRLHIKKIG